MNCIDSWQKCGFRPITINAESEATSHIIPDSKIESIRLARSAEAKYGKPVLYLADFLSAICSEAEGPIAITNADILLHLKPSDYDLFKQIEPGSCFVSKRIDIEMPEVLSGSEFKHGYDFFVFHSADLRTIQAHSFALGMPWWDHFLPLAMYLKGCKSIRVSEPFVYHLSHTEQWYMQHWIDIGNKFFGELLEVEKVSTDLFQHYFNSINNHLSVRQGEPGEAEIQRLHRLGDVNVAWIDWRRAN